jgi:hypothetical protein
MVECVSFLLLDNSLDLLSHLFCCDRHIFGTPPEGDSEDENRPPTMAETIRAKRAARKATNNEGQQAGDDRSLHSLIFYVFYLDTGTLNSHREQR